MILKTYFTVVLILTARYWLIAGGFYLVIWKLLAKYTQRFQVNARKVFSGQEKFEIKYSFLTTAIFAIGGAWFIFVKENQLGLVYTDKNLYGVGYWYFTVFLMLGLNDLYFYWTHRWLHSPRLFAKVHFVHHKSRTTTPLTSQSFHAVESFINILIAMAFPFLFPVHPTAYFTFAVLVFLNNVYGHGNYDFVSEKQKSKFPFKYLNSPTVHGFHHSNVTGNYGLYTNIWDRIHGTYVEPKFDKV